MSLFYYNKGTLTLLTSFVQKHKGALSLRVKTYRIKLYPSMGEARWKGGVSEGEN